MNHNAICDNLIEIIKHRHLKNTENGQNKRVKQVKILRIILKILELSEMEKTIQREHVNNYQNKSSHI